MEEPGCDSCHSTAGERLETASVQQDWLGASSPIAPQPGDDEEYVLDTPTVAHLPGVVFRIAYWHLGCQGGGKEETNLI